MKSWIRIPMMLLMTAMTATSCDGSSGDGATTYWTVNIEPEYVLSSPYWGGWGYVTPHMEAINERGDRSDLYALEEIRGFTFEEGYRYQLHLRVVDQFKKTGQYLADASQYEFYLNKIISKEYVGIRQEGRRDVEMDVEEVRVRSTNDYESWEYIALLGKVVGTDETLLLHPFEIYGLTYVDFQMLRDRDEWGSIPVRVRMKVSITPSEKPIFPNINHRIRLIEVLGKQQLECDSIIYRDKYEEFI